MTYKIKTKVMAVEEKEVTIGHYATGETDGLGKPIYAPMVKKLGWFVRFKDSWESLFFGTERPTTPDNKPVTVGMDAVISVDFDPK